MNLFFADAPCFFQEFTQFPIAIIGHSQKKRIKLAQIRFPRGMPKVIVFMDGKNVYSDDDGSYIIKNVPISTRYYLLKSSGGKILVNQTIYPLLEEGNEMPRKRDLIVERTELINA